VRVTFWITANVNLDSPNYQYGLDHGYYLSDGRTVDWWKGEGSFIDFTNPDALQWWHSLMDIMLDMEIDGWKCDGTGPYLYLWIYAEGYSGIIWPWEYMDMYYREFFNYSRERLGDDRVTLSRPFDSYGLPAGLVFAPRDVLASGWVGDQDPTFPGMRAAMFNIFESGERAYVNVGSDIAGYREDEIRDKELFVRWAQLGALCPIMENGGGGEHRPWMYDQEVLDIYRDFTLLHYSLKPYLYSQGADAYTAEVGLLRQIETATDKYRYMLGDNLFVTPFAYEGLDRDVEFPEGTWIDWFTGTEYTAPHYENIVFPLDRYPLYIRKGGVIPLDMGADSIVKCKEGTQAPITARIDPLESDSFNLYEEGGSGAVISYNTEDGLTLEISATSRDFAVWVHGNTKPASVSVQPHGDLAEKSSLEDLKAADTGWFYDSAASDLWIKPGSADRGLRISVK